MQKLFNKKNQTVWKYGRYYKWFRNKFRSRRKFFKYNNLIN